MYHKKTLSAVLTVMLLCTVAVSCKKSSTAPAAQSAIFMKFTFNGTTKSYDEASITTVNNNGVNVTTLIGFPSTSTTEGATIVLSSNEALAAGATFSGSNATDNIALMDYLNNNIEYDSIESGGQINVSLSAVGTTTISGTFSGTLTDSSGKTYPVTGGSFSATVQKAQ